jgi:ADP-L-glycero-D-manno-heptose 6-epimerase
MEHRPMSGLYNLGTGKASTFLDLVRYTFKAMDREVSISYIDTPNDIRDQYQYFTEANMKKLRAAGYTREFTSLKDGIEEYVCNFMERHRVH